MENGLVTSDGTKVLKVINEIKLASEEKAQNAFLRGICKKGHNEKVILLLKNTFNLFCLGY